MVAEAVFPVSEGIAPAATAPVVTDVVDAADHDDALTMLAQLGGAIEPGPLPTLVRPLLELLGELSGLEAVYLTRIDWEAEEQHLEIVNNTGLEDFEVPEGTVVQWADTMCELSLASGSGWNVDVAATWGHRKAVQDFGVQSFVSVPVQVRDDAPPYGTLCGASPRRVEADPRIVDALHLFAQLIATAIQRDLALTRARARAEYAEERLAGRIAFAAQVEHAMRTPITVIGGWAQTIADRPEDEELREQGLEIIGRTTARLGDQVSDLLAEARSAVGAGTPEDVDVREIALELSSIVTDHDYVVHGNLMLHADPVAVHVLLEHLVENAVAHTPPGTEIRVLLAPGSLVVEDDGPGLPDRDDLFDPFVSADPNVKGTGLGLHIIASIAERLGATLEAGASESGGARFTLDLA